LFQHLRSTSESVTGFTDGDVEHEFLDAELAHGVARLVLAGLGAADLLIGVLSSGLFLGQY